jgi:CheY-like chemotaxis protein
MARILIVEDYPDIRQVAELILIEAGHLVVSASGGLSGLQLAMRDHPDLILMDLALPDLDGWETTRRLKSNPGTQDIPVVAFTATVTPDAFARAIDAGCVDVIAKPFDIDAFLQQITALLPQSGQPRHTRTAGDALEE